MTRPDSESQSSLPKNVATLAPRAAKVVGSSLILFILSAILLLGVQGITLFDRFSRSSEVGLDNQVWFFSQLEIEAKNFNTTLLEALSKDGDPKTEDSAIRASFDIYFSRVSTTSTVGSKLFSDGKALAHLTQLQASTESIARSLDANPLLTEQDIRLLHGQFARDLFIIRRISSAALLTSVEQAEKERDTRSWIVGQLQLLMVIAIIFMIASVLQAKRVSKSIAAQAVETAKVAARMRRILNTSLDAVVIVDVSGRVREHNAALRNIFRADGRARIVDQNFLGFIVHEERDDISRFIQNLRSKSPLSVAEAGSARRVHARIRDLSGGECPVELSCAAEASQDGDVNFVVFIRDRSQEVAAANVLRDARDRARLDAKAKERFLSVLSHEMRTPLHGVMASLELIQMEEVKPSEHGFLLTAQACAKSALTQIDDVLALTRNGYLGDADEPFFPATLIDDIVGEIVPLAIERGNRVEFRSEGNAKGLAILSKSRSFKLSVRNLISNAVKYTDNGIIDVALLMNKGKDGNIIVEVAITDTGIGISKEDQVRIFDEFAMVNDKGSQQSNGFGLGLAIAKSSVERLQGRIDLKSELGKGSRFNICFEAPVASIELPAQPVAPPVLSDALAIQRPLEILIVDDNPVNRALLCEIVKRLGHNPDMAIDGTAAFTLSCAKAFDLILMDLSMPGLNGFETARLIRSESRNATTRIFALTARDLAECQTEILRSGMQGAFQKPIGMAKLRELLSHVEQPAVTSFGADDFSVLDGFQEVHGLMGTDMTHRLVKGMVHDSQMAFDLFASADWSDDALAGLIDKAHRAGGSAAVMGATRLAESWRAVEGAARRKGERELDALIEVVRTVFAQTLEALASHGITAREPAGHGAAALV